eukprot:g3684.t1
MGIQGLWTLLKNKSNNEVVHFHNNKPADRLLIDGNGLVFSLIRDVNHEHNLSQNEIAFASGQLVTKKREKTLKTQPQSSQSLSENNGLPHLEMSLGKYKYIEYLVERLIKLLQPSFRKIEVWWDGPLPPRAAFFKAATLKRRRDRKLLEQLRLSELIQICHEQAIHYQQEQEQEQHGAGEKQEYDVSPYSIKSLPLPILAHTKIRETLAKLKIIQRRCPGEADRAMAEEAHRYTEKQKQETVLEPETETKTKTKTKTKTRPAKSKDPLGSCFILANDSDFFVFKDVHFLSLDTLLSSFRESLEFPRTRRNNNSSIFSPWSIAYYTRNITRTLLGFKSETTFREFCLLLGNDVTKPLIEALRKPKTGKEKVKRKTKTTHPSLSSGYELEFKSFFAEITIHLHVHNPDGKKTTYIINPSETLKKIQLYLKNSLKGGPRALLKTFREFENIKVSSSQTEVQEVVGVETDVHNDTVDKMISIHEIRNDWSLSYHWKKHGDGRVEKMGKHEGDEFLKVIVALNQGMQFSRNEYEYGGEIREEDEGGGEVLPEEEEEEKQKKQVSEGRRRTKHNNDYPHGMADNLSTKKWMSAMTRYLLQSFFQHVKEVGEQQDKANQKSIELHLHKAIAYIALELAFKQSYPKLAESFTSCAMAQQEKCANNTSASCMLNKLIRMIDNLLQNKQKKEKHHTNGAVIGGILSSTNTNVSPPQELGYEIKVKTLALLRTDWHLVKNFQKNILWIKKHLENRLGLDKTFEYLEVAHGFPTDDLFDATCLLSADTLTISEKTLPYQEWHRSQDKLFLQTYSELYRQTVPARNAKSQNFTTDPIIAPNLSSKSSIVPPNRHPEPMRSDISSNSNPNLNPNPNPNERQESTPGLFGALPIDSYRETIISHIRSHRVTLIHGETGCGKSSRVPVFVAEEWGFQNCKFFISQPRRVCCESLQNVVSQRLQKGYPQLSTEMDDLIVGLRLGHGTRRETLGTRIWFVTAGYLGKLIAHQPQIFAQHTHLIIDEVHERSVDTDLLLLLARRLMRQYPHLKLILMSATLQASSYLQYFREFHTAPKLFVGAKRFPVEHIYLDSPQMENFPISQSLMETEVMRQYSWFDDVEDEDLEAHDVDLEANDVEETTTTTNQAARMVYRDMLPTSKNNEHLPTKEVVKYQNELVIKILLSQFLTLKGSSVLIFCEGIQRIESLASSLAAIDPNEHEFAVYAIHSSIAFAEQKEALNDTKNFANSEKVRVVLATNTVESSVTIDDCDTVICLGMVKRLLLESSASSSHQKTVAYAANGQKKKTVRNLTRKRIILQPRWISRASVLQRAGRTGRVRPGTIFHLYTKKLMQYGFDEFDPPEIQRTPLDHVVLK